MTMISRCRVKLTMSEHHDKNVALHGGIKSTFPILIAFFVAIALYCLEFNPAAGRG